MIDFATLQGLAIPEGVVTQIADASGRVLWALQTGSDKVILEVEKIVSDTYAGETTYTGEEFILLDIYPKTNGTVSVTYGGLTKTITDTSGAAEPNAIQVFFGTFNGVSDSVATPASGTLTIEGDYSSVASGLYTFGKMSGRCFHGITQVKSFGTQVQIPNNAFGGIYRPYNSACNVPDEYMNTKLASVKIPDGMTMIGAFAFMHCVALRSLTIPASIESIGDNPFAGIGGKNPIIVNDDNPYFKIDGNCLIEVGSNRLIAGFSDSNIPSYITTIDPHAFHGAEGLTSVIIPNGVTMISTNAFDSCTALTSVRFLAHSPGDIRINVFYGCPLTEIIVPAGCGEEYKTHSNLKEYANLIVEAS